MLLRAHHVRRNELAVSLAALAAVVFMSGVARGEPGERPDREQRMEQRRERAADGERAERGERRERAERGPGGPGEMAQRMQRALFRGVELTEEQREQVQAIARPNRDAMEAWMVENRDRLSELREQVRAARESGDEERMQQARQAMRAAMEEAPRPDLDAMAGQVRDVLTDEQKATFDENLARIKERMERARNGEGRRGEGRGEGEGRRERRGPQGGERGEGAVMSDTEATTATADADNRNAADETLDF